MEIAHYIVRHFTEKDARRKIELFVNLRNLKILGFDANLMAESVEHLLNYGYNEGLGGRDATIIAAMNSQDIRTLITHDEVFKRISSKLTLNIIDPIKTK
jgi:predicted nucleic acid-binding protein